MSNGFGKLSQLRTDEEVIQDTRKIVGILNEIIIELERRELHVSIDVKKKIVRGIMFRDIDTIGIKISKEL